VSILEYDFVILKMYMIILVLPKIAYPPYLIFN